MTDSSRVHTHTWIANVVQFEANNCTRVHLLCEAVVNVDLVCTCGVTHHQRINARYGLAGNIWVDLVKLFRPHYLDIPTLRNYVSIVEINRVAGLYAELAIVWKNLNVVELTIELIHH